MAVMKIYIKKSVFIHGLFCIKDNNNLQALHATRYMGGVDIKLHSFLTPAFHKGQWSTSQPGCFTPGKEH